jgi:hypothetical protein
MRYAYSGQAGNPTKTLEKTSESTALLYPPEVIN